MTSTEQTTKRKSNYPGLRDLFSASVIFGAIPLIIVFSGGQNNPLLLMALWSLANACGFSIYLRHKHKYLFKDGNIKKLIGVFLNRKNSATEESLNTEQTDEGEKQETNEHSIFNIFRRRSIFIPIQGLGTLLFAWSFQYVHNVIATVVYESWPILFIFLLVKISPDDYSLKKRTFFLFLTAFASVVLIVLSGASSESDSISFSWNYVFGLILLLFAIIFTVQDVPRLEQSKHFVKTDFEDSSPEEVDESQEVDKKEEAKRKKEEAKRKEEKAERGAFLLLTIFSLVVSSVLGFVVFIIFEVFNIAQGFSGTINPPGILIILVAGPILTVSAAIFGIRGTIEGKDVRVQAVRYLTPIFATVYLVAFSPLRNIFGSIADQIPSINWTWFIAGFIGVISANTVLNFKTEDKRFGLTSLVMALWISGVLIFFRDEWNWWAENVENKGFNTFEYYAFLGGAATVFALLIAFEISRTESRTIREEELVFSLVRRLQNLYSGSEQKLEDPYHKLELEYRDFDKSGSENKDSEVKHAETIMECLEQLDAATNSASIKKWYEPIVHQLETDDLTDHSIAERRVYIGDTITDIDTLAHSKQQGRGASEWIAIVLLSFFIIALSFGLRPVEIDGLPAILVDTFGFLLSAVVAYLSFHLLDLRYNRKISIIQNTEVKTASVGKIEEEEEEKEKEKRWRVEFQQPERRGEATVATILVAITVITYVVLYCIKWLG